jgi:parallel beta-helix repeat protein
MNYSRNLLSVSPSLDTIEPLPAYAKYLNLMGQADPVLSANDRAGMAAIYGAGPGATNLVTNTQDSGPGSLRAALYYAYDHPGTTISFNISVTDPGFSNSVFNILPSDNFPSLVNATFLDGSTEPTNSNPNGPAILLNGILGWPLSVYSSGLQFKGTNCVARAFVINNFPDCGVLLNGSNTFGNTVSGCLLGVDATGTIAVTNGVCPVQISGGAVSNLVGGTTAAARNVISGGFYQGLVIRDPGTRFNAVQGNYIGLNAAGTAALANTWEGIEIFSGAQSNLIGGCTAAAGNVISGNSLQGVLMSDPGTSGNTVAGNFIGLSPDGSAAISNGWSGVEISGGASANVVGPYNVISGNGNNGVLFNATAQNVVWNNFIGLNAAGTGAVGNTWAGVQLYYGPQSNSITGNVVSGNGNDGVMLAGSTTTGNVLTGNLIGLNAAGDAAVANAWRGVDLYNGAATNQVGGLGNARNFISGNGLDGVYIAFGSDGNVIQGNTIGLDIRSTTPVPNGNDGVLLYVNSAANLIGGVTLGAANLIAGNAGAGVQAGYSATNNPIRGNSIFNNVGGAISLYVGGNNELPAPALTAAVVTTNTVVSGTYTGVNGTDYQLDFYADAPPAASAEAMTYLGAISVAGTGGSAAFTVYLGVHLPAGRSVTATATDPDGNTSQLSTGIAATMTSTPNDGIPDAWRAAYFGGNGTTTNSQSAWFADPDHDGMNNYQEFLAGTNPTNAASVLKLTALNPNSATNFISLNSSSGTVYRILSSDDLSAGFWSILADQITGTGTNLFFYDPAAPGSPRQFYRAQVLW